MPTISGGTVGAGGTYATWAAWAAAAPADLTVADVIWQGRQLAGELSLSGSGVTVQGTTDATRYFEICADTGASFRDNANKATNPLRYDATKGAATKITGVPYGLLIKANYTRVHGVQMMADANGPTILTQADYVDIYDAILVSSTSTSYGTVAHSGYNSKIRNCLVLNHTTNAASARLIVSGGASVYDCTAIATQVRVDYGITGLDQYTKGVKNNYIGGATTQFVGSSSNATNNFTDVTTAGFSVAPLSTATFVNTTYGTHDFRLVAGSALIDAGVVDAANAPYDIIGTARPVGTSSDIGAWEFVAGGGATAPAPTLVNPSGTPTGPTTATATVSTDTGGGTIYALLSTNPTETAATIEASSTKYVSPSTGYITPPFQFTGLSPSTTYYAHFVQVISGTTSNVVNSTGFTTTAVDSVAPVFPNGAVITPGAITSSSVAFSYPAATDNVGVAAYYTSKDNGATWQNNGSGLTGQFSGLPAGTAIPLAVQARDAQGNASASLTLTMTTAAATTGSFKTRALANNTGTLWAQGTAVSWQWHLGARIGTAGTSITYGSGQIAADGTITATGLPVGSGYLLAALPGATLTDDKPFYQPGTAA